MFILAEVKQDTAEKGWISQSQWNHGVKHLPQHLVQNCNKPLENNNKLLLYSASNNLKNGKKKQLFMIKCIQILWLAHIQCNEAIKIPKPYKI